MIVLFNMNEYLGGGETLLLRLGRFISSSNKVAVITSTSSYIAQNIDFECEVLEIKEYNYYYMNQKERNSYIHKIETFLSSFEDIKIVSFCFRELYAIIDLLKFTEGYTPFHLLLHPLDHMYVGQNILDKFILKLRNKQKYSKQNILELNKKILTRLNDNNLLISMSKNISYSVLSDFNIKVNHTIALPVFDDNLTFQAKIMKNKRIVWIGRLVNSKLPSIFAMIDFLDKNSEYSFHIIGSGSEDKIKQYIDKKNNSKLHDQIYYLGKIDYKLLRKKLVEFDIGYAMGTSIVELSSASLPTIVATSSPDTNSFNDELCSGMLSQITYGDVGDDLYNPTKSINDLQKISKCIRKIEENYQEESKKCFDTSLKMFSIKNNSEMYQKVFNDLTIDTFATDDIIICKPDFLKKIFSKIIK